MCVRWCPCAGVLVYVCVCGVCVNVLWLTEILANTKVLWTFKAHVWVNDCAPWNLFFFFCFFFLRVSLSKLFKCSFVHLFFVVHLSCRIWFDDISVWYSYICSFLIHSVELCGSSLEDCHLHGNSGKSVLWNLFCWRHHMTWCYLLLNVLAIFMVE